jgi:DNA-binding IclR family transcriptional regulator
MPDAELSSLFVALDSPQRRELKALTTPQRLRPHLAMTRDSGAAIYGVPASVGVEARAVPREPNLGRKAPCFDGALLCSAHAGAADGGDHLSRELGRARTRPTQTGSHLVHR